MPLFRRCFRVSSGILIIAAVGVLAACQFQAISPAQLEIHESWVDRNGLSTPRVDQDVQITCAPPVKWEMLPLHKTLLYAHQQWRSPDRLVGMGVAHLRTPIPFSAQMVIWFARQRYTSSESQHGKGGRLIRQWNDTLGRAWFEAENNTYHVTGCAMTHGLDAWIVYSGYRVCTNPSGAEIALSAASAETVIPLIDNSH